MLFVVSEFKERMVRQMATHFKEINSVFLPRPTLNDRTRLSLEVLRQIHPRVIYTDNAVYASELRRRLDADRLAREKSIPIVLHMRGDWWSEAPASIRWNALSEQWLGCIAAAKILPICKHLEKVVRGHLPDVRTEVVYQGVEPSEWFPENGFMKVQHPAVAIVQNHSIMKKVQGLVDFAPVVKKMSDVHFYVSRGEATGHNLMPYVDQAFHHCLNVHYVDADKQKFVRQLFSLADAYVLPSGLDQCPTTVLEAKLMHLPVVASYVGGIPEITNPTILNGDVSSWESAIRDALEHKDKFEERDHVANWFGWDTIAKQTERILIEESN